MEIVYATLIIFIFTYMTHLLYKLKQQVSAMEDQLHSFDRHFRTLSESMEKKISESSSDVESVRTSFKTFQTNFLDMEQLIKKEMPHDFSKKNARRAAAI